MYSNKVVWITGASSGIGEAFAKEFNRNGANVILSSRNVKELERVQSEFSKPEIGSAILALDLRNYNNMDQLAEQAIGLFGKVNVLLNNGGISQRSLSIDTPFNEELRLLEIDLIGTIAITKAILPHLIQQQEPQIVVISSVMGKINTKYRTAYAAAKHGLVGYFESLRLELDNQVNVCNIMPGFINTNIVKNAVNKEFNPNNSNAAGMSPEVFAQKAIKEISKNKKNVYIGGIKEQAAMLLKRASPSLFDYFIKNSKVV